MDGSENSFRALEEAIFLATKIQEAQITVLYIIEDYNAAAKISSPVPVATCVMVATLLKNSSE